MEDLDPTTSCYTIRALKSSVVDLNTLNLDQDPSFLSNLDPDPA